MIFAGWGSGLGCKKRASRLDGQSSFSQYALYEIARPWVKISGKYKPPRTTAIPGIL